ncbi:MAG: hypothetical protein ACP5NX_03205 [Candidatus Bilamarchaeaceae archaeon]
MADFDETLITTGVDGLVRLVMEKKSVELGLASEMLKIPPSTIEEWAHVLEEEGLISLEYKLTKVYLRWTSPTKEEVVKRREHFVETKEDVKGQVARDIRDFEPKAMELDALQKSFNEAYANLSAKLERFESVAKKLSESKKSDISKAAQVGEEFGAIEARIGKLASSIESMQADFDSSKKEFGADGSKKLSERVAGLKAEFLDLEKQVASQVSALGKAGAAGPKQRGSEYEAEQKKIKSSVSALAKEIDSIKSRVRKISDSYQEAGETMSLLKDVDAQVKLRMDRIEQLRKDAASISGTPVQIAASVEKLNKALEKESRAIADIAESMKISKDMFKSIPDPKSFAESLKDLDGKCDSLSKDLASLEKAASSIQPPEPQPQVNKKALEEFLRKHDELVGESKRLFASIDENTATYNTFQKIKEKAFVSIAGYNSELASIKSDLESLKKLHSESRAAFEKSIRDSSSGLDSAEIAKVVSEADSLLRKKDALEAIAESLESLKGESDNINKKLKLLSKQAELIQLRESGVGGGAGGPGGAGIQAQGPTREEVESEYALTRKEQASFEEKREELRSLIKKLWEEG